VRFDVLWGGGEMAQLDIVDLADAIEALRDALTTAMEKSKDKSMRFRVEPIELTLQAVVTKDANGRIGWGALGVGGSYEAAKTQTLTLRLRPVWRAEDGTLLEELEFTIAGEASAEQQFGSK
jgi:hypothetical protein